MTDKLSKAIMNKSTLRNKCLKWPSRENFLVYGKVKNKCNSLNEKAKKSYFQKSHKNWYNE